MKISTLKSLSRRLEKKRAQIAKQRDELLELESEVEALAESADEAQVALGDASRAVNEAVEQLSKLA